MNRLRAWRQRLAMPAPLMEAATGRARRMWGLVLVVLVALAFVVRASWYLEGELEPAYLHEGYPGLSSADGYFFAAGVGAATTDAWGEAARVAEPERHALVLLGAALVELGVPREAVFTWLPPMLGALVVVPIFLLGWFAGGRWVAGLAGLGASFAPAHVGRTTVGYFDTDVFSVTVPLGVAALLVAASRSKSRWPPWALCGAAVLLALYPFTYDQGGPLALAMVVAFAAVAWLGPWLGEAPADWRAAGLLLLVVSVLPVPVPLAVLLVVLVFGAFRVPWWSKARREAKGGGVLASGQPTGVRSKLLGGGAWLALMAVLAMSPATASLVKKAALYAGAGQTAGESLTGEGAEPASDPAAVDTTPTVAEARTLPAEAMFAKAAGHVLPFVLGLLGLALLWFAVPSVAIVAPIVGVGLFAFVGGHRFLVYLAPVLALGVAWLIVRGAAAWPSRLALGSRGPLAMLGAVCFVPAALATVSKEPRPLLVAGEVAELERLAERSTPDDTTIAWWDYGYPIAYHAKTRVVADGARRGDEAALVAEILMTHDDELARRLALIAAQAEKATPENVGRATLGRARAEGLTAEQWLERLADGRWPMAQADPQAEVFLYMPLRMMPIVPVIASYRLGARTSVALVRHTGVRPEGRRLILRDGLEVDADMVSIRRREPSGAWRTKALRSIHSVSGSGARLTVREKRGAPEAPTAGVFLADLALFIELDADLLGSTWARLFLFEQPSQAFELVSSTPGAKVFRVRSASPPTR